MTIADVLPLAVNSKLTLPAIIGSRPSVITIAPRLSNVVEALAEAMKNGGRVMNSKNKFAWRIEADQIGIPDVIGIMWYAAEKIRANITQELPI